MPGDKLTAAAIRAAGKAWRASRIIPVEIEGHPPLWVREITGEEFDRRKKTNDYNDLPEEERNARFVCAVLCDEDGSRVMDENNPDDVQWARELPLTERTKLINATANNKVDAQGN